MFIRGEILLSDHGDSGDDARSRRLLHLGVLVILADDLPDLHRRLGVQVYKLKARVEMVGKAQPRIHAYADVFRGFGW